jgi:hypothetical protein
MAFLASQREKYRELLKTGDAAGVNSAPPENWRKRFTGEDRVAAHEIMDSYREDAESGTPLTQIAEACEVAKSTLARHAWTRGWDCKSFNNVMRRQTMDTAMKIIQAKNHNNSWKDLCKKHGISWMSFADARLRLRAQGKLDGLHQKD